MKFLQNSEIMVKIGILQEIPLSMTEHQLKKTHRLKITRTQMLKLLIHNITMKFHDILTKSECENSD